MAHSGSSKNRKHQYYEYRTSKLDNKNSKFTHRKFQRIRKGSSHKKALKSLAEIGISLNDKKVTSIPIDKLDKVCLILINSYRDRKHDLGVGPLNDGCLVGLKHYRLGYKVFYLYDPRREEFLTYFGYFLKNTEKALTVFYSGRDTIVTGIHGIEFKDGTLSNDSICDIIANNCNSEVNVMLISDCCSSGSVFDINIGIERFNSCNLKIFSLSIDKTTSPESKEGKETQGLFTFYLCKYISIIPNISPNHLVELINTSVKRFKAICSCQTTTKELAESQIYAF